MDYPATAELGILDLMNGEQDSKKRFVLAWKVKPKGTEPYPYAYIDAISGGILQYDDGIRH